MRLSLEGGRGLSGEMTTSGGEGFHREESSCPRPGRQENSSILFCFDGIGTGVQI